MDQNETNLSKKEQREIKKEEREARENKERNRKKWGTIALWSFITLFVGGTIALMIAMASKNSGGQFVGGSVKAADESDWVRGAAVKDSKVVLTEYGDFQCPACGAYYPLVKQLEKDFPNLTLVFRHFPLPQHGNAWPAAQAAEAAGAQGKFWEMHDMLYENQDFWSGEKNAQSIFQTYAQKLGLNIDKFKADFDSSKAKNKIEPDLQGGTTQINGTPTFFLNNQKIENPQSYEQFKSIIQQAFNS